MLPIGAAASKRLNITIKLSKSKIIQQKKSCGVATPTKKNTIYLLQAHVTLQLHYRNKQYPSLRIRQINKIFKTVYIDAEIQILIMSEYEQDSCSK